MGKPNVGKSSLLNKLSGSERSVVHDVAGTTVDPVDSLIEVDGKIWRFVDTAGLRRRVGQASGHEFYASVRTHSAIDAAEVVVVLIDGSEPITEQDQRVLSMVIEAGRALVLAFNKWDLVDEDRRYLLDREIDRELAQLQWAPRVNISAKTGRAVQKLVPAMETALASWDARISTGQLNTWLKEVVAATPPPVRGGKQPRILFATQATAPRPPSCCSPAGSWKPATGDSWNAGCGRPSASRAPRSGSTSASGRKGREAEALISPSRPDCRRNRGGSPRRPACGWSGRSARGPASGTTQTGVTVSGSPRILRAEVTLHSGSVIRGGAQPHRAGGQQRVLHAGVDRAEERRLRDERVRRIRQAASGTQARHHQHRDLAEVVDLPLHRPHDLLHRLVLTGHPLADRAVGRPGLPIAFGELIFHALILDDNEFPVLPVGTGRGAQREFDALAHDGVVDRVRPDAPTARWVIIASISGIFRPASASSVVGIGFVGWLMVPEATWWSGGFGGDGARSLGLRGCPSPT